MERARAVAATPELPMPAWVDQPLYVADVVEAPVSPVVLMGPGFALVSFRRPRRRVRRER